MMSSVPQRTSARSSLQASWRTASAANPKYDHGRSCGRAGSADDPFAPTNWRIMAGGNAGHMPKTSMRKGAEGFWLRCDCCARDFQSLGLRYYCHICMALPADKRRDQPKAAGDICQRSGCGQRIPKWRNGKRVRSDVKYCSEKCAKASEYARKVAYRPGDDFRGLALKKCP